MEIFSVVSEFDGISLAAARRDVAGARVVVQISHGMAEHKERYFPFMEYLAERGIASFINDHRGHGASVASAEDLGYFGDNGAEGLLSDLNQMTHLARDMYPGAKIVLLGHSMGALAVRAYIQKFGGDIDALMVSGNPGYSSLAPFGVKMARRAQRRHGTHARCRFLAWGTAIPFYLGAPSLTTRNAWLSTDPELVRKFDADPLCGFEFTANGYEALLTMMLMANDPNAPAPDTDMPVAFFSGANDVCMSGRKRLDAAAALLKNAGYRDVSVTVYPGMRHEIFNEKGKAQVYADMADWIMSK